MLHQTKIQNQPNRKACLTTDLLNYSASQFPNKCIIHVDPVSGEEDPQSYFELKKEAEAAAAILQVRGFRPGDHLIFVVTSSRAFVTLFWACQILSVIPAPLAPPLTHDPGSMEAEKIKNVIAELNCPVLFDSRKDAFYDTMIEILGAHAEKILLVDEILSQSRVVQEQLEKPILVEQDVAILQYSSGSSGSPKSVMLSHENLLSNVYASLSASQSKSEDVLVSWMSYFHDFGLFWGHLAPVALGMTQIKMDPNHFARRPALWLDKIHQHKATLTNTIPTALEHLLSYLKLRQKDASNAPWQLDQLRSMVIGAEMINAQSCREFIEFLKPCGLRDKLFISAYGLTETTMGAASTGAEQEFISIQVDRDKLIHENQVIEVEANSPSATEFTSVGSALDECDVRIVDDTFHEMPPLKVGQIQIRGRNVTAGYHQNQAATETSFHQGWFNSGDLGFFDRSNNLYITGRAKEIIIVGGKNYYPYDIEQQITRSVNAFEQRVRSHTICGFYNPVTQKDEIALFIVANKRQETDLSVFVKEIADKLTAASGLHLDHVVAISNRDLPRTSSGKIMRRVLSDRLISGEFPDNLLRKSVAKLEQNETELSLQRRNFDRSEIVEIVKSIWTKTLDVNEAQISDQTALSALGCNSIKAGLIQNRLESAFHIRLESNFPYLFPTLDAQVAALLARDMTIEPPENEVEYILQTIIKDVLGIDANQISMTQRLLSLTPQIKDIIDILYEIKRVFDLKDIDASEIQGNTPREIAHNIHQFLNLGNHSLKTQTFPLMNFQETLYFHKQGFVRNEPSGLSCFIFIELMLDQHIDAEKLLTAFNKIIERHPILKATINEQLDRPRMTICERPNSFSIKSEDLRALECQEQRRFLTKRGRDLNDHRFEIDKWPLFLCELYRLENEKTALLFNIDHFLVDGYSFMTFLEEVLLAYDEVLGRQNVLKNRPHSNLSFRDYVVLETARQKTRSYQKAMDMQLGIFSDLPDKALLPFKCDPASIDEVLFETDYRMLSPELISFLSDLAGQYEVTLNSLLMAAYFKVVNLWANQQDLVINMPVFNRDQYFAQARHVMGSFIDIFPVRIQTKPTESVISIAQKIERFARELLSNPVSSIELSRLIAERDGTETGSMSSLIFSNSIGVYEGVERTDTSHVKFSKPHFRTGAPGTFIDLVLYDFEGEYYLNWNYIRDLFEPEFINTLAVQYEKVLSNLKQAKDPLDNFDPGSLMLDRHQTLIEKLTNRGTPYPDSTLHECITKVAQQNPELPALVFENRQITYDELDKASNAIANLLHKKGVKTGDFVALLFDRCPEMIIAQLGILKSGAAYVPLDPSYPADRLAYMIEDSQAKVLVGQAQFLNQLSEKSLSLLTTIVHLGDNRPLNLPAKNLQLISQEKAYAHSNAPCPVHTTRNDLAYMIYTSGSTGEPKGVMIRHHNILNFLDWVQTYFKLDQNDCCAFVTSYAFDMTLATNWSPLLGGAQIHILDEERTRDVDQLLQFLSENQITFLNVTPSHFSLLSGVRELMGKSPDLPLAPHMQIMLGGEVVNSDDLNAWLNHYPTHEFINEYGPTETSVASSFFPIPKSNDGFIDMKIVPIGQPLPNTSLYILDSDDKPCLPGVSGELCIGGDGVAVGYHRKEDKTRAAFVPNPFLAGEMMYRTGDRARLWDDGNVEFLGREDHQINLRGFRIEAGEIEATLRKHDDVRQAVITTAKDKKRVEKLVAFYTTKSGAAIEYFELKTLLESFLPQHMIPAHFVWIEKLPRTPSGKFDAKQLPEVNFSKVADGEGFIEPRTETERKLATIWCDLLSLEAVSVTDDFRDLGGNSLTALRLVRAYEDAGFGNVGIQFVLTHNTIEQSAQDLDQASTNAVLSKSDAGRLSVLKAPNGHMSEPFVLAPYACGNSLGFSDLAQKLGPQTQVLCVELPTLEDKQVPSIKTIAQTAIESLQSYQDGNPPILCGYSYGGYIAYEMAKQLIQKGQKVAGLVMIASSPPSATKELEWVVSSSTKDIVEFSKQVYSFDETLFTSSELDNYVRLLKQQSQSMLDYQTSFDEKLACPTLIITGKEEEDQELLTHLDKWKPLFTSLEFKTLPGRHMLIQTHTADLARSLQDFSDNVRVSC